MATVRVLDAADRDNVVAAVVAAFSTSVLAAADMDLGSVDSDGVDVVFSTRVVLASLVVTG